jgi:ArsR family transcriptional regulator
MVDHECVAALAKALAHPARVQIVELLARQSECRGAEVFAELPLAQSTVSEHLRVLKDAGVISVTSLGAGSIYCLNPTLIEEFRGFLASLAEASDCCSFEGESA